MWGAEFFGGSQRGNQMFLRGSEGGGIFLGSERGGPEFFTKMEFFLRMTRGDQNFLRMKRGGQEQIVDRRSQADGPPIPVKMITP